MAFLPGRFIQQALLQVMNPIFDPDFSPNSFGFRPGKKAHDAVKQAQSYIQEGYRWVVDMDLEKFFDRVNHDIFVKSERAGKRVMESVIGFVEGRLKLKVNRDKSAVDRPWNRKFLGFSFLKNREASYCFCQDTLRCTRPMDTSPAPHVSMETMEESENSFPKPKSLRCPGMGSTHDGQLKTRPMGDVPKHKYQHLLFGRVKG